jgi:uncharacterized protein YggU (UPF0235/DUF167 family)
VKVAAAPDKRLASKAVMERPAQERRVPRMPLILIRGETDRNELFELRGEARAVAARLKSCIEDASHGKDH